MTMPSQAHTAFPFHLHWTADELADSVPRRLIEMPAFDATRAAATACANHAQRRPRRTVPPPGAALAPSFRVH
jgi:hypothetical protein